MTFDVVIVTVHPTSSKFVFLFIESEFQFLGYL